MRRIRSILMLLFLLITVFTASFTSTLSVYIGGTDNWLIYLPIILQSSDSPDPMDVPIAGLVATNDSPTLLGSMTAFTATISAGTSVSYTWALGDGVSGIGANVQHTYAQVGSYTAIVTATNSRGSLTNTTEIQIDLQMPTATLTPTTTGTQTPTPMPPGSATATATYTPTPMPTATATQTPTPMPPGSATATATYTPTPMPTATYTPTPTPMPTVSPTTTTTTTQVEVRGLWVTRFDWTTVSSPAEPAKIDEMVENAATTGFNVIYFQVRGAGDAYYTPGLEPWARRVSGTYGQAPNPLWDPLAYFVEKAHERDIQLHAYINVYPMHDDCQNPPDSNVSPTPFYYLLEQEHGTTEGKLNGLQWATNGEIACSAYLRATPASIFGDNHLLAIGADLVNRYDIDGIHLDHIRYAQGTSCDPVSEASYGADCFSDGYADWQRVQVNGTVRKFYEQIVSLKAGLWLSAAVWPIYQDYWGWNASQGYHDYYQDSKAWLAGQYIDSISPMIYPSTYDCNEPGFWTLDKWQLLVANFQADSNGRFVIPGIGTSYCEFSDIAQRIEFARTTGTAGHALFSYRGLLTNGYFDDLAAGPYAEPAVVPDISWHP